MADKDRTAPTNPGQRDMMKRVGAGVAGATFAVPAIDLVTPANAQAAAKPAPAREALETLTAMESDTLEAMVARIIPTDEIGPGAAEARAAHYVDRALAGPLASRKGAYVTGLAALDAYARSSRGAPFANLSAGDQNAVLTDVAKNAASGFANSAAFFNMVRGHTIEGTFCDPYYGGNANFRGLGPDRLPRCAHGRLGGRTEHEQTAESRAQVRVRRGFVQQARRQSWPLTSRRPTWSWRAWAPRAAPRCFRSRVRGWR